ncbi:MAG: hypothetical protein KC476_08025 [Cyanobacteria bacterium HKST-UBA06]|nr:hypothetical protein [Cyanobacteria bacterium HKST-UBA05]MCA9799009.1 hypothetical protein [Cyanobacteria bacterium HKST-UBA04]MCA9807887.1 hypothetical protein [Cyanobacteria bacterium HKST-UBA06]MCA9842802.1 hypothetical protein [Cyanobacteria bacterium HKST-UBA03]
MSIRMKIKYHQGQCQQLVMSFKQKAGGMFMKMKASFNNGCQSIKMKLKFHLNQCKNLKSKLQFNFSTC